MLDDSYLGLVLAVGAIVLGLILALELVLDLHAGHLALHLALHVLVVAQLVVYRLLALVGGGAALGRT